LKMVSAQVITTPQYFRNINLSALVQDLLKPELLDNLLVCKEVYPCHQTEWGRFFQSALDLKEEFGSLRFLELTPVPNSSMMSNFESDCRQQQTSPFLHEIIADRSFLAPHKELAFIEATRAVTQNNKESLATLFDHAENADCKQFIACVDKSNPSLNDIIRSFMGVGFSRTNAVNLPGYALLVKEL